MSALLQELRGMIAAEGPLPVERYMQLCLQHPVHGYYTSKMPFGRAGDFITAPEVSQMFGELAGLWAAQVWMDMGAPGGVHLTEIGPGRGTMMADVLRAGRAVPGFLQAIDLHLVETSPLLREAQRRTLEAAPLTPVWHEAIETLPDGPAIVLANEFFDALPVRHYIRSEKGWHERQVGLGPDGNLVFGAAAETIGIPATAGRPGDILEIGHVARALMTLLATRIATQGGALLVWDYGHAGTGLGETLQAIAGHAFADPLAHPGEADLTVHVDFAMLRRAAEAAGAAVHGPVAQGLWLERLGIFARAQSLKSKASTAQALAIDSALARLTAPGSSMATLFKVLAVVQKGMKPPPGFED
jgi:NADH dehydrogenase [ubiquinone] 1 alpha subcomplex assembly factor 7